jgi:hypothetical protein
MSKIGCHRVREAFSSGLWSREEKRHLLSCPDCRGSLRLAQAWRSLPRPEELERRESPGEVFVARVLGAVRRDRGRRARLRAGLAAAAALLFFFLAGAAGQLAAGAASADEEYAQLEGSTSLDSFLPE